MTTMTELWFLYGIYDYYGHYGISLGLLMIETLIRHPSFNLICCDNTYKEGSSQQLKPYLGYIHYFACRLYCLLVVCIMFVHVPCIGTTLCTSFTSKLVVGWLVTRWFQGPRSGEIHATDYC